MEPISNGFLTKLSGEDICANGFSPADRSRLLNGFVEKMNLANGFQPAAKNPTRNGFLNQPQLIGFMHNNEGLHKNGFSLAMNGETLARTSTLNGHLPNVGSPVSESFSPRSDDTEGQLSPSPPSPPSSSSLVPSPTQRDSGFTPLKRTRRSSSSSTDSGAGDMKAGEWTSQRSLPPPPQIRSNPTPSGKLPVVIIHFSSSERFRYQVRNEELRLCSLVAHRVFHMKCSSFPEFENQQYNSDKFVVVGSKRLSEGVLFVLVCVNSLVCLPLTEPREKQSSESSPGRPRSGRRKRAYPE